MTTSPSVEDAAPAPGNSGRWLTKQNRQRTRRDHGRPNGLTAAGAEFTRGGNTKMKLGQAFDPRNNALNAFRLALATSVILWHSFEITGRTVSPVAVRQLLSEVGVD